MWSSLHEVLGSDVDNVAANGRGGVYGQGLVLVDCESVQFPLVDGTLINSVGNRSVDQLTTKKSLL